MLGLLLIALAPGLFLLLFIYARDRYEKEPLRLIAWAFFAGVLIVIPAIIAELGLSKLGDALGFAELGFWKAFMVAGLCEEGLKLFATYKAAYRKPAWNEPFDGIVYATAVSLGFATIENVLYVLQHGLVTGVVRAIISVPGHALFGIAMGYYLGRLKAGLGAPRRLRLLALLVPLALHGIFDLLLFRAPSYPALIIVFLLFDVALWFWAERRIRQLQASSPFRGEQVDENIGS